MAKKGGLKRAAPKMRARKAKAGTRGFVPLDSLVNDLDSFEKELQDCILREGGAVVGGYYDPIG